MSKHRPDLGTHGLPRARARRGPHRPCPRVTDPASRPSQPSGACGRPARGAPRGACRAARGISASAGGVPARPPARAPAPAAPAGVGCAALLLLLLDGRPRVLVRVGGVVEDALHLAQHVVRVAALVHRDDGVPVGALDAGERALEQASARPAHGAPLLLRTVVARDLVERHGDVPLVAGVARAVRRVGHIVVTCFNGLRDSNKK